LIVGSTRVMQRPKHRESLPSLSKLVTIPHQFGIKCVCVSLRLLHPVSGYLSVNNYNTPTSSATRLLGSITVGREVIDSSMGHVAASPLGRPHPMGTVSTSVILPTTSVLSGDHRLAARRPRPLPAPLFGGNQGRWPLWVSSSSVSYMTSK